MNLKNYKLLIAILIIAGAYACKKKDESSMEADKLKLESLMTEIKGLSEVKCEISEDWKFRPIGTKACGGPTGYIAYSSKIDTVAFIQKVNKYTADQKTFNEKWSIISDCSLPARPEKVICENDIAKLVYKD
ncbi:MAG: hypothetical protein WC623_12595 [Pedobacter sp.]|uniref:hypothetical protein n=1 Tax=Pedobacter sp. TaxID=1411316 RepID=UPI003568E65B